MLFSYLGVGGYLQEGQCRLDFAGPRHKITQLTFKLVTPPSLARYPFKTKCSTNHVARERLAAHSPLCENLFALKKACNTRTGVEEEGALISIWFARNAHLQCWEEPQSRLHSNTAKFPLSHARILLDKIKRSVRLTANWSSSQCITTVLTMWMGSNTTRRR